MKIISKPKKEWWVNKTFKCSLGCGVRIKLEEGDKVTTGTDREGSFINFKCPSCGHQIYVAT